jgi:TetR/AcrR family transcriptional regulator, cholesterol catabolism regulator
MNPKIHPLIGSTRRDRRIDRQRKLIMDASAQLFSKKGYAATTTKDIAEAADVGESTLYSYFPGKRDILDAILNSQIELFDQFFKNIKDITSREEMIDLQDRIIEQVLLNKDYSRALLAEVWVDEEVMNRYFIQRWIKLSTVLANFLSRELEAGLMRVIDPTTAARFIIATSVGVLLPYMRSNEPPPTREVRREISALIISLVLHGLAANPAL